MVWCVAVLSDLICCLFDFLCRFFFYCSGALRVLHSFPTRRSSDLVRSARSLSQGSVWKRCLGRASAVSARRAGARHRFQTDRKSTRLNSSHGYISYAVFCLKKKKKKKTNTNKNKKIHTTKSSHQQD